MDDLISRQAAIRWVKTESNPYGKPTLEFESGKKVIEHLEQMPSEQPEVIRCYECKYASYEPCGHVKNVYVCNRTPWTRMNGGNLSVCFCSYAEREGEDVHD